MRGTGTRESFQDIPVAGFRYGKSLKDHLIRAKLTNVEKIGKSESCGKRTCQVCGLSEVVSDLRVRL